MQALDIKLLRDFRRLWAQALAIALVLASGVAILLTGMGMSRALDETRAAYYERNRFAEVFADARRAPRSLLPEIADIAGVRTAEGRVTGSAILDIEGRAKTAVGHILSLPSDGPPQLNVPILRTGRLPDPDSHDEVAVNEPFAIANGLKPGDRFEANLGGSKRSLMVTGALLSPEFVYTLGPGALMPDNEGFGIIWMPERTVASAYDMSGAFNSVTLTLTADAEPRAVIDALDELLEPYGGTGAYARDRQQSNSFLDAEIKSLRSMSVVLPPIFFGIAAFLVNMVIGRIVALERSEIGLMKAIGYSDVEICVHYLLLAALIAVAGIGVGWVVGSWLSHALAVLYADFFNFPYLIYRVSYSAFALSGLIGLLTAALGAIRSALYAARLPPAVAMSPPAPPRYKRNLLDKGLTLLRLTQPVMMIFRSVMRWPIRSGLTALGMAMAVAVLVAANFLDDSLNRIIDTAFYQANRQDAMLLFSEDQSEAVLEEVHRLPGVLQAEGQKYMLAMLHHGQYSKRVPVEARRPDSDLSRVVSGSGSVFSAPGEGILLSERLASELHVQAGDVIEVEFLTGLRETHQVPVDGTVIQYFGLGAYMDLEGIGHLFRQMPRISVANVTLDDSRLDAFNATLKDTPNLAGTIMLNDTRRAFQETIRENVIIMNTIYITIAVLITVGVSYNGARIQLSERARELASLRILGFTRAEVSLILVGETMLLALLAQPLGWLLGVVIARAMTDGFASDLYTIPLVLKPATFSLASLIVLGTALGAALMVRRRLDQLDLVTVMKTRE